MLNFSINEKSPKNKRMVAVLLRQSPSKHRNSSLVSWFGRTHPEVERDCLEECKLALIKTPKEALGSFKEHPTKKI